MDCVQQCGGDTVAPLDVRTLRDSTGNLLWIARLETPVGTQVKVDADVGECKKRAGRERDGTVFVVRVE